MTPQFSITNKMLRQIVEITQLITRLELTRERDLHLRKENRLRTIHSSLAIENNSLSLDQVTDIINGKPVLGKPQEIHEVKNAYEAYEKSFRLNPYSVEDFLTAHALLTADLVENPGKFRNTDVGVFDNQGKVVHVGARPEFVPQLVKELFEWGKNDDTPDLIKSCIIHFEIEIIHPFEDGNGRMGRMWQSLILSKFAEIFEWIPIETIIYQHQQEYYAALEQGNNAVDSTVFIEFMLDVILETLKQYPQAASAKIKNEQLNARENEFLNLVLGYLQDHPAITNKDAQALSGKSPATVRGYFAKLVDLDLLEADGNNKARKYRLPLN
ncbi:Fic family protein [Enterococcus sp. 669A]|uniref:Fic family protein n=1 Tax=Candidatus Enterococcus moelleringii TaxID=2815325 RepID=A0ABS3LAH3_9ENTE|nr:Fic family protein [Enterococcus sp. 669A]MBO1306637.1 Fic family protein [Enterococcus sp. 669A]